MRCPLAQTDGVKASDSSLFFLGDFKSMEKGKFPALFPLSSLGGPSEPGRGGVEEARGEEAGGEEAGGKGVGRSLGKKVGKCGKCTFPIHEADITDGFAEACDVSPTGFFCDQSARNVTKCLNSAKKATALEREAASYRVALSDASFMRL